MILYFIDSCDSSEAFLFFFLCYLKLSLFCLISCFGVSKCFDFGISERIFVMLFVFFRWHVSRLTKSQDRNSKDQGLSETFIISWCTKQLWPLQKESRLNGYTKQIKIKIKNFLFKIYFICISKIDDHLKQLPWSNYLTGHLVDTLLYSTWTFFKVLLIMLWYVQM